jgi:hypothetical protein
MWYASLTVGEADRLPETAFRCDSISEKITPLTEGAFEPTCKPYFLRNCLPGTAGSTTVTGTISRPQEFGGPFSFGHVTIAYRTVEGGMNGEPVYGATRYVRVGQGGRFSLTTRGCGAAFMGFLDCDGGVVEAWPAYNHARCGETPTGLLVAGEVQKWNTSICDIRGVIEGHLHAGNPEAWTVVASGERVYTSAVKEGEFLLRLPRGNYRFTARSGHKQCAMSQRVKVGLAQKIHLTMHC